MTQAPDRARLSAALRKLRDAQRRQLTQRVTDLYDRRDQIRASSYGISFETLAESHEHALREHEVTVRADAAHVATATPAQLTAMLREVEAELAVHDEIALYDLAKTRGDHATAHRLVKGHLSRTEIAAYLAAHGVN